MIKTAEEKIRWHCASCGDVFNFEDLVSDPLDQWDLICESCQHERGKMSKQEANYLIAEGIALKHNLHTDNPSKRQTLLAMEEYAQARLKSVSSKIKQIDTQRGYTTAHEVKQRAKQIIKKHFTHD